MAKGNTRMRCMQCHWLRDQAHIQPNQTKQIHAVVTRRATSWAPPSSRPRSGRGPPPGTTCLTPPSSRSSTRVRGIRETKNSAVQLLVHDGQGVLRYLMRPLRYVMRPADAPALVAAPSLRPTTPCLLPSRCERRCAAVQGGAAAASQRAAGMIAPAAAPVAAAVPAYPQQKWQPSCAATSRALLPLPLCRRGASRAPQRCTPPAAPQPALHSFP